MKTVSRLNFPHLNRIALHAAVGGLVFIALALSLIRFWLLPRATDWQEELQTKIGTMIDETVRIKSLSADMRGFKPELMMRGFRIENASGDGTFLEFERLGVGLDLAGTLLSRKPVVNRIDLEGGKLRLFQRPDGTVAVAGLKPGGSPLWLFAEGEVRFVDVDLEWIDEKDGQSLALGRVQARLKNAGGRHLLDARMDLPGKLGKSLKVSVDLVGDPLSSRDWNGRVYLEAKRIREGAFRETFPVRLRSGEAGLQVWGEWRTGVFSKAVGRLDLDRPVFTWRSAGGGEGMASLDKLGGWLLWNREENGWRMDVRRLELSHKGRSWPQTDLAVAVGLNADGGLQSLRAAFDYLHLDAAQSLLATLPVLDETAREKLRAISPQGEVRNGRLLYRADGRVGFCGELKEVGFKQFENLPSISGFSGRLCGNDRDGLIDLTSARPELNLPGLFPKPVTVANLSGRLQWRRFGPNLSFSPPPATSKSEPAPESTASPVILESEPVPESTAPLPGPLAGSAWRIAGNGIKLSADGLLANGGFALDLPSGESASPSIDLKVELSEVEAARLRDYLPVGAMGEHSGKWLSEAFDGGKVKKAEVLLRGSLADFPFPYGEGLFEARVDIENVELDFNPEWPHLYGVTGKVIFFGSRLFIDSEGGRIGEIPLQPVHAETEDFIGDGWLGVAGELDSDLASAMKFLQKTPIRHIPERLLRVADPSGEAHLDLKLSIPLNADSGDEAVEGVLQLKNDTLEIKGMNLTVSGLTGQLTFTESGMDGSQIAGMALNEPILLDVRQQRKTIFLDVAGKADVAALGKTLPHELWKYAEGDFLYQLNLQFSSSLETGSEPMRLSLASDLSGLELKFPAPLSKPAAMKKDLSAELVWWRGDSLSMDVSYGHEGRARLLFALDEPAGLWAGDVVWGRPTPPFSDEPGLGIYVKMDEFNLGSWRKLFEGAGERSSAPVPRALDVQVSRLLWDQEDLGPLRLTGQREGEEIFGEVNCRFARGSYSATTPEFSHATLRLDLDNLSLPKLPESGDLQTRPNPADLPALKIRARHFQREGMDLGALELEAERWTLGMNIKRLNLVSDNHALDLRGSWMRQGGQDETRLDGKLTVRDLGVFLTTLGYRREFLFTPTEASFSLAWVGAPQQYSAATVAGDVRLKTGRGSVLQVEPGLGRALGILNLQTLRRLLLLDFSDLFGKGLTYDKMEGVIRLGQGQAVTTGLLIDAAPADILIMGRVGLVDHDLDQTISVVPHTLASIPLAGAILGGEAVGAVIDMARRLVGADDVNFASTNYAVTGSWDNPQTRRLEGSMSMDVIKRAWSNFKDLSGMGGNGGGNAE